MNDDCGSESAYARHIRRGEPTDKACRIAHTRAHHTLGGILGKASVIPAVLDPTQRRAALVVVDRATGPDDARHLLAALGFIPTNPDAAAADA